MSNSNRCPRCGGVANLLVTDVFGRSFHHCNTGLTSHINREGELTRDGNIIPCDTVMNSEGKVFTGTVAYKTGGNTSTLSVTDGKIRR